MNICPIVRIFGAYMLMLIYNIYVSICKFFGYEGGIIKKIVRVDDFTCEIHFYRDFQVYIVYVVSGGPILDCDSLRNHKIYDIIGGLGEFGVDYAANYNDPSFDILERIHPSYINLDDYKMVRGINPMWINCIRKWIEKNDKIELINMSTYNTIEITSENYNNFLL